MAGYVTKASFVIDSQINKVSAVSAIIAAALHRLRNTNLFHASVT